MQIEKISKVKVWKKSNLGTYFIKSAERIQKQLEEGRQQMPFFFLNRNEIQDFKVEPFLYYLEK
jgi:hypothetical protein